MPICENSMGKKKEIVIVIYYFYYNIIKAIVIKWICDLISILLRVF